MAAEPFASPRPTARIKDLPPEERPRERLLSHGTSVLSDAELLAVLIGSGSGSSGASALQVARRLLATAEAPGMVRSRAEVLRRLATAGPARLCRLEGIGPAKAARIVAAVELGRRIAAQARPPRHQVEDAVDVYHLLCDELRFLTREEFRTVLLDARHRVLAIEQISVGGLDASVVHPREVFAGALEQRAAAVVLVHNHPSGDPEPSTDDLAITRRLVQAGEIIGIEVLDHVIIGDGAYISMKESGLVWE